MGVFNTREPNVGKPVRFIFVDFIFLTSLYTESDIKFFLPILLLIFDILLLLLLVLLLLLYDILFLIIFLLLILANKVGPSEELSVGDFLSILFIFGNLDCL